MKKLPTYLALFGSLVVCITPVLAQDAQSGYGPTPGYETPQSDAYRGQAQTFGNTAADSSTWAHQQAIEAGTSNNNTPSSTSNAPIKPTHEGLGKLGRAVGHIGSMVGRAAAPAAAMGAYYMITKSATQAGMQNAMMAQRMGMGGYGGMPMGGMGMPMGGMGMPMGGYGMPMGGYGYNPMMNMMRGY